MSERPLDSYLTSRWLGKRIFVLGDVMLDRFVDGQVERVSPEAPVPVLHFQSERLMLGGAANVARNVAALGGSVILAGVVGSDEAGASIADTLTAQEGIEGLWVRLADHPTTIKTRFVCGGQQIMRLDVERPLQLSSEASAVLRASFDSIEERIDAVILSDYSKGVLTPPVIRHVIERARARGIPVVVDPKARDVARYAGASVLTPNLREAETITGLDCRSDQTAEQAARSIRSLAGVDAVVITRGAQGMTLYPGGADSDGAVSIPTVATEVFDVSGAGDTVTAVLALALSAGLDLAEGARLANLAAGIVVGKRGTAVVRGNELTQALRRSQGEYDRKVVSADEAAVTASQWRDRGYRVGFTNGCFDLLHPGHVELLQRARQACNRLIVALNTDASVRRLKGASRPVQNEAARATVIASIGSVDLVTFFDQDTPLELIRQLRPDVLIKGADYTVETVVGSDLVRSYGGEVRLVPLSVGHSTTSIINRAGSS